LVPCLAGLSRWQSWPLSWGRKERQGMSSMRTGFFVRSGRRSCHSISFRPPRRPLLMCEPTSAPSSSNPSIRPGSSTGLSGEARVGRWLRRSYAAEPRSLVGCAASPWSTPVGAERLLENWSEDPIILLDPYFQSVLDALLDRLRTDTAQRLSLVEAAGIAAFDFSSVVNWSLGIHLFTWTGSRDSPAGCWAIFGLPGLTLNTPPARTWQDARQWLLSEFGLDSLAGRDRPIDIAAQTFAGLMQDARAHYGDGRVREAFLYFVIALDHLLGEDGRNVSTVADRTSVLTHRIRSKTFADEVACVRRVYNARSRLVHSGSQVTVQDLHEADALACGVLWAITRVAADDELDTPDAWVAKIDSLAHLFRGDPDVVTDERLAAVGAVSAFRAGPPPPMLRDRAAL
jgi:hypothetical protein